MRPVGKLFDAAMLKAWDCLGLGFPATGILQRTLDVVQQRLSADWVGKEGYVANGHGVILKTNSRNARRVDCNESPTFRRISKNH